MKITEMEGKVLKKVVKRFMVLVLVITLATCNTGTGFSLVKAEEIVETKEKTEVGSNVNNEGYCEPEVVEEIVSDRTTDSTTFLLSNGMKQTTYYSDDIYFENEKGQLSEYDNEFVKLDKSDKKQVVDSVEVKGTEKEKYSYVNKEGDSKQFLPSRLSEKTPIVMAKENCIVSFSPADVEDEDSEENILSSETEKVKLDSKSVTSVYDGSREEKKVIAGYEGENKATELSYESLEHGLKETIILKNKPKSNVVSFNMTLQGCYAKVDETGGGITLYSEDDDIVGGMEAPFMDDATENNYSEEIYYELTEINEKEDDVHRYILKLVIDEKYLENATYPVAIDPTVTWNGTTDLPETYVLNSTKVTNYFSSGVKTFSVGKGSQGVFRTYFRAKSLAKTVKDKYIDRATLTVYENGSGVNGSTIYVKPAAASFKCGTVTWKNQPGGTSANLASFKSKGSADAKHEINLKTWAQNVAKGSGDGNKCYGLLFKAGSESSSSYVRFYGARASSHVPKLKVVYYDAPTTASAVTAKCSSDANRSYLKSGESLKVSWAGISAHALSYVQYRITDASGNALNGYGYSASTKIGTTASGNSTINVSGLGNGTYKVYVRGVDKGGIVGTGKGATFYIDKTKPVIKSAVLDTDTTSNQYSEELPELDWCINDSNFSCIQVSINNGAYKNLSYENEDCEVITGLISGQANTIKVRAVDKAGNVSDVKSFTYYYDEDAPVISASINPNTNSEKMDNSEKKPVLKYTISDKTLKSYEVELNGEKINVNGSSGEVELKNVEEGENNISITATDKAGNGEEQELTYYRDTVTPEAGYVKVIPKTGFFNTSNKLPIVYWSGFSDDNLSEIQIKINDREYKTLGLDSSGEGQLQGVDFSKDGKYTLTVRAVDKGGNVSKEVSCNYYYETADYELDDYTPINVYAVEQIGGNTILRFSTKSGKFRDDVKYQVYRSETPNVVIDNDTLVKSYSSKGMIKVSGEEGKTYYYKIRTVKKTENGNIYSDCSEEISSGTIGLETKNNRLGNNSMFTYSSVSNPNGTGQIELSKGNFLYEQDDISLPAISIPVKITRYYNSKSLNKSSFGYGWNCEYDAYVSECDDKYYYSDGSRAVYTFEKQNTPYMSECVENADMKLKTDDDVINKTVEKTTGEKENLEIDVHYKVTDKTGEILRFDDAGRLVLIEEANNNFVCISYNEKDGKIKSVSTDKGQKAVFSYNEEGLVSKISVEDNAYGYSYTYEDSHLVKATYQGTNGKKIEYKYSYKNGLLSDIVDANGNSYLLEYNANGTIGKYVKPNGEHTKYSYGYSEGEKLSKAVVSSYNGSSEDKKLSSETYSFAGDGRVTEKKDGSGNVTTYEYDKEKKSLITNTAEKSCYYALENNKVVKKNASEKENTEYYPNGNIKSEKDSSGNIITYEYNDTRNDFTKVQPTQSITKDSNNNIISNRKYEYDEKGNILKETDFVEKKITRYEYSKDGSGLVKKVTETLVENTNNEANGIEFSIEDTEYNEVGDEKNENSVEGTVEEQVEYTYDRYGNVIEELDKKSGNKTQYEYDDFFRTIKTTETKTEKGKTTVKTTQSKYDNNGNVVESTDECGRITTYTYDSLNRNKTTTLKVGSDTKITKNEYTYGSTDVFDGVQCMVVNDAFITTIYNEKGEELSKSYVDGNGRTVKELSNGFYSDYTYDSQGKVFTTYVSGMNEDDVSKVVGEKLTVTTYDAKGNQTSTITNPEITGTQYEVGNDSIVTKKEYDVNGNVTKSVDGEGNVTSYEYDNQGRVTQVTTPEGNANSYKYDNIINDKELINLKGVIDNKLVESTVTDAMGNISRTYNNGAGQTLKILDEINQKDNSGKGISTVYEYDDNGQQIKETYADGSYVQSEYEASTGYLLKKSKFNKNGKCESYTTYSYDTEGNVQSAIDYKNGESYRHTYYEYDKFGRNIAVSEINAGSTPSKDVIEKAKIKYVYNVDDNIEKIYYPNNSGDKLKGIKFVYNKDKWITEIDGILSDKTVPIRKYEYYNDSKIQYIRDYKNFLSNGTDYIQRDYEYDGFDRVTSMKYYTNSNREKVLESYEYKYDRNSNITYKHEKTGYDNSLKDEETNYSYDKDGRLVASEKNNRLLYKTTRCTYRYDKVGNRTYESELETDTVATDQSKTTGRYSYNSYNSLNQLTSSTVIECKDGSSVKTSSKSYKYDVKGNQISATDTGNGTVTSYEYDVENQLVDVKIEKDNVEVSRQHNDYNGQGQRIRKTETTTAEGKSITTTTCYYYEGSVLLYTTDDNGKKTSQNIIGNENNTFAGIRYYGGSQSEYFYSKDVQGSTTAITNGKGECSQSYSYTDYGEISIETDSDFYNEICYTGGIYDELTGLYYLNARYYNADEGEFLSQDTYRGAESDENSWNLYAYCAGNPISYVDTSGHFIETLLDAGSIVYSGYELINDPSWGNLGYLAWDIGATFLPYVPGSYVGKGAKAGIKASKAISRSSSAAKVSLKFRKTRKIAKAGKFAVKKKMALRAAETISDINSMSKISIGEYRHLKKSYKGVKNVEVHHIIEKRLLRTMKTTCKKGEMLSIPLSKNLHKKITKRWKKQIGYGTNYSSVTKKKLLVACDKVYGDMPKLKTIAKRWIEANYGK